MMHHKNIIFGLLVVALFILQSFGQKIPPKPTSAVADYAQIIDPQIKNQIDVLTETLWQQTRFALVIVTVQKLEDYTIDEYANNLFNLWHIGEKGKDEAALILLSMSPRKVKIEVGYGAEGYLTDGKVGSILDQYAVDEFKKGRFGEGLLYTAEAINQVVRAEKGLTTAEIQRYTVIPYKKKAIDIPLWKIILGGVILLIILSTRMGRLLVWGMILSSVSGSHHRGFGGGFGKGGFGGGFGGFGGGSSGGGGASRGF